MNSEWLTAFVLHRRPYRETSYIVDFFSLEEGRVSAVAKGVKNSKSDKKSLLQPFQALRLQLAGKSELKNLRHVESTAASLAFPGKALFCAMYVNELVNRIMPSGLSSDGLFHAYTTALTALSSSSDLELTLREFEFSLLEEMGLLPDFTFDLQNDKPIVEGTTYYLHPELGFYAASDSRSARAFPGAALLNLANGEFDDVGKKVAKLLCRDLLKPLIGDKPLKSRELFSVRKR